MHAKRKQKSPHIYKTPPVTISTMASIVPLAPLVQSSIMSETIKSEPSHSNFHPLHPKFSPLPTATSFSIFKWINIENPHQQTLNELSPDLNEEVGQKVRRLLSKTSLMLFFVCCIVVGYQLSTSGEIKPQLITTLAAAAGFVMSTRFDLGLVHDYISIIAMANVLILDWTTLGHVKGEAIGLGIVLITTTTLPFKGPLLRNHVELMMLAFFILARVGYGHDKVSAPRYRNCGRQARF